MKKMSRILAIIMVLASLASLLGCSNSSDNTPNNSGAADMMRLLDGGNVPFEFFDINAIRNDADLAELWNYLQSEVYLDDSIVSFGIANAPQWERTLIYEVSNVSQKMAAVERASSGSYQHGNVTVWKLDHYISAVQIDNYILIGQDTYITGFIFMANNEDKGWSLYDNEYYRTIIDRLPSGYMTELGGLSDEYEHMGGLADGMSVVNQGISQQYTWILKISDEAIEYIRAEENNNAVPVEDDDIPSDGYFIGEETIDYVDYESINQTGSIKPPPWWNE